MKLILGFLFSMTLISSAHGQTASDSQYIYSFGGSCSSQGSWTATALSQTATIRGVIQRIAGDTNCTGLAQSLTSVVDAEEKVLRGPVGTTPDTVGSDNAQAFTQALYSEASSPTATAASRGSLMKSLLGTAIKSKLYNLNADSIIGSMTQGLNQVATSSSRTMDTALGIYDQLATSLPAYQSCLIGRPSDGSAAIAALIKLGAAFASSGAGVMNHWGDTAAKMVNLMRNEKIAQALKLGGNTELLLSMSCLLESTTQAFCSTRDAQVLLNKIIKEHRQVGQSPFDGIAKEHLSFDGPLAGYYILSQHLPNISSWLQSVLLSADPKWIADGNRMASALDNVNNFLKSLWILKGTFRENINTMMTTIDPQDLKGRQNALLTAIVNIINGMNANQSTDPTVIVSGTGTNFFTSTYQPYDIPFILLGVPTPREVVINPNGQSTDYKLWISQDGFFRYPQFNDPVKLADVVEINLKKLMNQALIKASNFYRTRIIFNKETVINKTLVDMPYTVKESLRYISLYLDSFEKLLRESGSRDDKEMLPSVRNTKYKIQMVLESYKILDDIEGLDPRETNPAVLKPIVDKYNLKDVDPNKDNGSVLITAAYDYVLQTTYNQFDILLQRDSFLTTTLSTFIYADYVHKTRNKIDVDQYTDDLLISTGQNLLNLLAQIHGIPPNAVGEDLTKAQYANKGNLASVEQFFRDSLLTSLERINMTAHNIDATDEAVNKSIGYRLFRDVTSGKAFSDNFWSMSWASVKGVFTGPLQAPVMAWERKKLRPDLYPFNFTSTQNISPGGDTDDHTYAKLRNLICIQILAFKDRKMYKQFCQDIDPQTGKRAGIVLKSWQTDDEPSLNVSWDQYMYNGQASRPVTDDSICAFRDFNRRGMVYWLTKNLKDMPNPEAMMEGIDVPTSTPPSPKAPKNK